MTLLFYGVLGVILGSRLGQVLFYEPGYYFSDPARILAIWQGGMSFHGGFLGVLLAMAFCAHKWQRARGWTSPTSSHRSSRSAWRRARRQLHQWRTVGSCR